MTSLWAPLSDAGLAKTWTSAWPALGRAVPFPLRLDLQAAWAERHRHYHDDRHLRECMVLWSLWAAECEHAEEVALALWFHDAVYAASFKGNELQSAAWAARALAQNGVASEVCQRAFGLVMATCHDALPESQDARILVDIDLAILGSPPARFDVYERDVRRKYEAVPAARYRAARRKVLERFLARATVYQNPVARDRFEVQARRNLQGAIERLSQ